MIRTTLIALATFLALLGGASHALASGRDVIDDCTDDEIMAKTYTQKEYRDALAKLPADADQYGNCRDIIARAQDAAATKGAAKKGAAKKGAAKKGGSGAATTPLAGAGGQPPPGPSVRPTPEQLGAASPDDRAAVQEAARKKLAAPVATERVNAGDVAAAPSSSAADLPAAILVLLALLLVGAIALATVRIRSLVQARGA